MVALVHDDKPVAGGQLGNIFPAGQRREQRYVDPAGHLCAPASDLTTFLVHELTETTAPLLRQGLAINQNER